MLWIAAAEAAESSKTLYYIVGGLLAGWAVLLAVIGISYVSPVRLSVTVRVSAMVLL